MPAHAQTADDGIMLQRNQLFVGSLYTHDSWDEYWEGTLARDNGNIGTLTTQANTLFVNYGVTDRINVIATIPYVWTRASQGVLQGMRGWQDLTIVAKYSALDTPFTTRGRLRAIGVVSGGLPLTDYTPDFMPLSIGSASRRVSGRFMAHYQDDTGLFGTGSVSRTWRGQVDLDRPYYYTDGRLTFSDQVPMPDVVDYVLSAGYFKSGRMFALAFTEQRTQGGGDIRRQDMPFVSNRMNFSKLAATAMYPIPRLEAWRVQVGVARVLRGRNVGQATTITAGLLYLFNSNVRPVQ